MHLKSLVAALVLTAAFSGQASAACTVYYKVLEADTCPSIISRYYGGSYTKFQSMNNNQRCQTSDLYVGQRLCIKK